jgi:hypothetical protein
MTQTVTVINGPTVSTIVVTQKTDDAVQTSTTHVIHPANNTGDTQDDD